MTRSKKAHPAGRGTHEYWHYRCAVMADLSILAHEQRADCLRHEIEETIARNLSDIASTDAQVTSTHAAIAEVRATIQQTRNVLTESYALLRRSGR